MVGGSLKLLDLELTRPAEFQKNKNKKGLTKLSQLHDHRPGGGFAMVSFVLFPPVTVVRVLYVCLFFLTIGTQHTTLLPPHTGSRRRTSAVDLN